MPDPTVLVADDEPALLELVARALERAGNAVVCAANGTTALEVFRERGDSIDVVVLDLSLPPSGALGLAREILAIRDVAVVLTSGKPADPDSRALLAETGGQFLLKPFPPRTLLGVIEAARGKRDG